MSPSQWTPPAEERGGGRRGLQTATCALCGIELAKGLMVPDGGQACDDLRWYCKDAKSCTQRWTSRPGGLAARPALPSAPPRAPALPPASGPARPARTPESGGPPPAEVPAGRRGARPDA